MEMLKFPSKLAISWFLFFLTLTNQSFSARTLNDNNPSPANHHHHHAHHDMSFYMLDVLGQKHPSSKPASTRVNGQIPFSKPLGYFPPVGGIPLVDTNPSIGSNGLHTQTLDLEGIGMTFPAITTLQELELGTVTTIDEDIYEGSSIYGSTLMGKAQGMYVASSEDGSSHMMAMTTTFLSNEYKDSLRFFGVHKGDVFESHIAVIGGTGKYHDANGYATVKIVNTTSNKNEGSYKILSFNIYLG